MEEMNNAEDSTYEWYKKMEDMLWQLQQATNWREKLEQESVELNQRIALFEP